MELSALFMCNILQRRQHMHFAGQAALQHLHPSSFCLAFSGKTKLAVSPCFGYTFMSLINSASDSLALTSGDNAEDFHTCDPSSWLHSRQCWNWDTVKQPLPSLQRVAGLKVNRSISTEMFSTETGGPPECCPQHSSHPLQLLHLRCATTAPHAAAHPDHSWTLSPEIQGAFNQKQGEGGQAAL
ncbi:hypothetical protein DV515_00008712 [Chloebia gouldiae]|uniref:Uncharacterized protein n=1 Tax=Chloebia gouldiae TaxID=44316 RepID=A0A3L8SE43_CHLGU|nr:hypothetical protein DV515_00008712 [Chloebia gouldiae]